MCSLVGGPINLDPQGGSAPWWKCMDPQGGSAPWWKCMDPQWGRASWQKHIEKQNCSPHDNQKEERKTKNWALQPPFGAQVQWPNFLPWGPKVLSSKGPIAFQQHGRLWGNPLAQGPLGNIQDLNCYCLWSPLPCYDEARRPSPNTKRSLTPWAKQPSSFYKLASIHL